ncbi:MAG TPA: hypothetical protein VFA21_03420 [Pyrinomonadaceae bacterium]|nr:hypothetical protein [Pyrinomonadaceae bacterium]
MKESLESGVWSQDDGNALAVPSLTARASNILPTLDSLHTANSLRTPL